MEITVGKVTSWLFGIGLILFGMLGLLASVVGGVILLLVGVFLLPPVRSKIAEERNITFSRWMVVLVFLIGSISGMAVVGMNVPSDSDSDASSPSQTVSNQPTPTATADSNLIEKSPGQMLPTVDDFESGWQQSEQEDSPDNRTSFYNVETGTILVFNVTVFESTNAAVNEYDQRRANIREQGISSEPVDVGNQGFLHKFSDTYIYVNIRVGNVVGQVEFDGPETLTPETNAVDFARLLQDTITR
jgi:hypothetical protein